MIYPLVSHHALFKSFQHQVHVVVAPMATTSILMMFEIFYRSRVDSHYVKSSIRLYYWCAFFLFFFGTLIFMIPWLQRFDEMTSCRFSLTCVFMRIQKLNQKKNQQNEKHSDELQRQITCLLHSWWKFLICWILSFNQAQTFLIIINQYRRRGQGTTMTVGLSVRMIRIMRGGRKGTINAWSPVVGRSKVEFSKRWAGPWYKLWHVICHFNLFWSSLFIFRFKTRFSH